MKINIQKGMTVNTIKQQFAANFPFLKLEIFTRRATPGHTTTNDTPAQGEMLIQNVQPLICAGTMVIDENTKVSDLESDFANRFLLKVQVFRRSKNIWLETFATDGWTLGQQNEHGRNMTENSSNPAEEVRDYELHRDED